MVAVPSQYCCRASGDGWLVRRDWSIPQTFKLLGWLIDRPPSIVPLRWGCGVGWLDKLFRGRSFDSRLVDFFQFLFVDGFDPSTRHPTEAMGEKHVHDATEPHHPAPPTLPPPSPPRLTRRLVMQPPAGGGAGAGRRPALVDSAQSATDIPELRLHKEPAQEKVRHQTRLERAARACRWYGDTAVESHGC